VRGSAGHPGSCCCSRWCRPDEAFSRVFASTGRPRRLNSWQQWATVEPGLGTRYAGSRLPGVRSLLPGLPGFIRPHGGCSIPAPGRIDWAGKGLRTARRPSGPGAHTHSCCLNRGGDDGNRVRISQIPAPPAPPPAGSARVSEADVGGFKRPLGGPAPNPGPGSAGACGPLIGPTLP